MLNTKNWIMGRIGIVQSKHAGLVALHGQMMVLAGYVVVIAAIFGAVDRFKNISLNRQVIQLTTQRDLLAYELYVTLEACTKTVVDEGSKLHADIRKIETAQAKEAKRLDDLTAKLVAMSSPKAAEEVPVKSGPQTLEACAQAVVDEVSNLHDKFRKIETAQAKEAKRLDDLTAKLVAMSSPKAAEEVPVKSGPQTQASPAEAIVATTIASVTPSPRRWYYLWIR